MNTVAYLEKSITQVQNLLAEGKERLSQAPGSRAMELGLVSLQRRLQKLQHELYQEKSAREIEVIELRLQGSLAKFGSIPLKVLSDLSRFLCDSLQAASYKHWKGEESLRKFPGQLIDLLDLRLAGLAPGSTRLLISGSTNPDLFGQSLLEKTLVATFDLVNSEDPESFTEAVGGLGSRSARHFRQFLKTLHKNHLQMELSWQKPTSELMVWPGSEERINQLWLSLSQTDFIPPERIFLSGEVITLSSKGKGKLEIRTDEGRNFICAISTEAMKEVQRLNLSQRVWCEVEKETIINETTGFEKSFFSLIEIGPVDDIGGNTPASPPTLPPWENNDLPLLS
jgi:hypothetical protein